MIFFIVVKIIPMKSLYLILFTCCSLQVWGQRNPTTNAGKIKTDTTAHQSAYSKPQLSGNILDKRQGVHGSLLIGPGVPQNGFSKAAGGWFFDLEVNLYFNLMGGDAEDNFVRIYYGIGFNYMNFGHTSKTFDTYTNPNYSSYTSTVYSDAYSLDLLKPRVELIPGFFSVFAEGLAGLRWFAGDQKIEYNYRSTTSSNNNDFKRSIVDDISRYYGYGFGFNIGIIESVKIECKYSKVFGKNTAFFDPSTASFDAAGKLTGFKVRETTDTDLNLFQIGLTAAF